MSNDRQESWYDEPVSPLSPVSLEEQDGSKLNPATNSSSTSVSSNNNPSSIEHQRQLAYDSLSPKSTRYSSLSLDKAPTPSDLARSQSRSTHVTVPKDYVPVPQSLKLSEVKSLACRESNTTLDVRGFEQQAPIYSASQSLLLPPFEFEVRSTSSHHVPHQSWPIIQPQWQTQSSIHHRSSISSENSNLPLARDTLKTQVKAIVKQKFKKKRRKGKRRKGRSLITSSYSGHKSTGDRLSIEDQKIVEFAAMKYPAMALRNQAETAGKSFRSTRKTVESSRKELFGEGSVSSGPGPDVSTTSLDHFSRQHFHSTTTTNLEAPKVQQDEESRARVQKYGVNDQYVSNMKNSEERDRTAIRAAALDNLSGQTRVPKPGSANYQSFAIADNETKHDKASKASTRHRRANKATDQHGNIVGTGLAKKIFGGFEERRREKLKDSITIVGGARIGEGFVRRMSDGGNAPAQQVL